LNRKEKLVLDGYTSTSESLYIALKYMSKQINEEDVSVMYQITGLSENGFSYF
jgi:hypothetical protein